MRRHVVCELRGLVQCVLRRCGAEWSGAEMSDHLICRGYFASQACLVSSSIVWEVPGPSYIRTPSVPCFAEPAFFPSPLTTHECSTTVLSIAANLARRGSIRRRPIVYSRSPHPLI